MTTRSPGLASRRAILAASSSSSSAVADSEAVLVISRVVVGEATTFFGGHEWLAEHGVEIVLLDDPGCKALMRDFIAAEPDLWFEDIGA